MRSVVVLALVVGVAVSMPPVMARPSAQQRPADRYVADPLAAERISIDEARTIASAALRKMRYQGNEIVDVDVIGLDGSMEIEFLRVTYRNGPGLDSYVATIDRDSKPLELVFRGKRTYINYQGEVLDNGKRQGFAFVEGDRVNDPSLRSAVDALSMWLRYGHAWRTPLYRRQVDEAARAYACAVTKPPLPEAARRFKQQAEGAVRDKAFAEAADLYAGGLSIAPYWPEGHYNLALVLAGINLLQRCDRGNAAIPAAPA